ncbi:hypothetical protein GYM73_03430 [Apibacter sp. ESL0432]|uniref:RHS repeat domain-containing protein n=1 Tax=Apibacter sp. ESL0432 TaxID=2704652 RepID=UPI001CE5C19B|nr:RHS repeat-associated core domain-containing protein [Apibacter sp. ESL0432]QYN48690.1 hypothetical protein GYM73_03430 [Apibacter sp. ESL0432]
MGYDNLHNIVSKNQQVSQQGIMIEGGLKAGYDLTYTYDSTKKNQIKTVQDINYREEESKEEEKRQEHKNYHYDLNGNLTYVNVELEKKDLRKTSQTQERKLRWDEENRLMSIDDNGYVSNYVYDATGERVIKTSGESEQVYINSLFSGGNTETQGFTAYINPYLVVSPNGKYTKHYYAGSQRIVSKLGDIESFGADPRRIEYAGSTVPGVTINWKAKYQRSIEDLKGNYAYFEVPYNGKDNDDYVNGEGFCCSSNIASRAGIGIGNVNYEKMQYYYHPDHLGSSSYITNLDGEIVQHVEYVPFGEVFIEERNNSWNTPYLFNGKELDEETGLYYYGARYYNPRESVWLSADPLSGYNPIMEVEHFIDGQHNGGVFNSFNNNTYIYCYQNPVILVDPNGKQAIAGAVIGAIVDYGLQVGVNYIEGKRGIEAWTDIDYKSIAVSAGAGALSAGIAIAAKAKNVGKIGTVIIELATDTGISVASQAINEGEVSIETTVVDVAAGRAFGEATSKTLKNSKTAKFLQIELNTQKNAARGKSNKIPKNKADVKGAQNKLDKYGSKRTITASAVGSGVGTEAIKQAKAKSDEKK